MQVADGATVTTKASSGQTGTWLIDPTDFTVSTGNASQSTSGIGATTLSSNLQNTSVTLATVASGSEAGDINVNAAVSWNANTTLTLDAHGDIHLNAAISASGDSAGLKLNHGGYTQNNGSVASGSDYHIKAPVTLSGSNASLSINGNDYTLIRSMAELDAIDSTGLSGRYALAQDLDASGTTYNRALVGDFSNRFNGTFTGLGHTISNLTIDAGNASDAGLFGYIASGGLVRDIGLLDGSVIGGGYTGGLAGNNAGLISNAYNTGSVTALGWVFEGTSIAATHVGGLVGFNNGTVDNAYANGDVTSTQASSIGGLVGTNFGTLRNVHASGNVTGTSTVGGLAGGSSGNIDNAYATGSVTGAANNVGGLIGFNSGSASRINNAYATGSVNGDTHIGGLAGQNAGSLSNVYATGSVAGDENIGGLVGTNSSSTANNDASILSAYATGSVTGSRNVGGLVGYNYNRGIIRNVHASGRVTANSAVGGLLGYNNGTATDGHWDTDSTGQGAEVGVQGTNSFVDGASITAVNSDSRYSSYFRLGTWQPVGSAGPGVYQTTDSSGNGWIMIAGSTRPFLASEYSTSISNAHQLQLMAYDLGASYTLASDIDASATSGSNASDMWSTAGFSPVGTSGNHFTGSLDGQSYAIGGLIINRPGETGVGLFGRLAGTAQGFTLANVSINGNGRVGSAVGYLAAGTLANVHVTGTVRGAAGQVGGLAGWNDQGSISGSSSTANVSGNSEVGGLVGLSRAATITDAYATGSVTSIGDFAGSLVGQVSLGSTLTNTYASGAVTGAGRTGGLVGGSEDGAATITSSYWDINSTGQATSDGGGTAIDSASARTQAALVYAGFDFANTWVMFEGDTRPMLRSEYATTIFTPHALQLMALDLSARYRLGADLNLGPALSAYGNGYYGDVWGAAGFKPVGNASNAFTGSLDGQGHLIRSLRIDRENESQVALIGQTAAGAQIRDLGLVGGSVYGYDNVASLVGSNYGGMLNGVYASVAVSSSPGGRAIGGLVARNRDGGLIRNSYATGNVSGGENVAGGLVGENQGTLENAYATGNVTGSSHVGGLVGSNVRASDNLGIIRNAYATGSVTGNNLVGGLIGYSLYGTVIDSFYATSDPGGNAINNSGASTGVFTGNALGTAKTWAELLQADTFSTWDLSGKGGESTVWRIYDGDSTPLLRGFLRALTVNADITSVTGKTYDGSVASGTLPHYTTSVGDGLNSSLLLGGLGYTSTSQNAGTYSVADGTLILNGLYSGQQGYDISYTTSGDSSLTIDKAALTVTANNASKTYDGLAFSGGNGVSYSGLVNGEDASVLGGSLSYGGSAQGAVNAGSYALNVSGLTSGNYAISYTAGALTIDKAALTVTAADASKTYDGLAFTGGNGVSYSGFVNGENADVLGGTLTYGGSAQGAVNAGSYALNVSGLSADNYAISYTAGSLNVDKAQATVTANSGQVTYNGQQQSITGFTATGMVNGETADVLSGVSTIGGSGINAGTYTHSASGTDGNYALTFVDGALTIDKAALTVTAADASKTYDGLAFTGGNGVSYSGFVNGENADVLGGTLTYGGSAQGAVNAGSYALNVSGLSADNYAISYTAGSLNVDKAAATVTANSGQVTYNGQQQSITGFTATGLVNGETADVLSGVSTTGGSGINAGTYTHSASGTDGNYALTFVDGALTIDKAALTVTANNVSKTYNGLAFNGGNGVSYSGFVNGEDTGVLGGNLSYGGSAQGAVNAGLYDLNVSGLTSDNYAISYNTGSLNVDKAQATVTANSGTSTYNGQQQNITGFTTTGLVNGETADVLSGVSTTGGSGINAGTYTHSASGTDGNYALTFVDGALTIDKAALTVTANNVSKTYNGLAFTGGNGVSYSGFVNGEDAGVLGGNLSYGGSAQGAVNAGLYDLSVSGLSADNYAISYTAGSLNVDKAQATVTANSGQVTYNGQQQSITGFTATGLVNGETADVLSGVSTIGGSGINAGTYTHSASGTDGNYALTFVDGALTIDKAALTATAADASKTYDGQAFTGGNGVSYSGFVNGEDAGVLGGTLNYGGSAQGAINAGLYDLSVSGLSADNYAISFVDGALTISDQPQPGSPAAEIPQTYTDILAATHGGSADETPAALLTPDALYRIADSGIRLPEGLDEMSRDK
ncbi:MBG domain-containing protein [Pseudomonas sp. 21C1]|nr:MBG domain-containing protein [Pseudomonas sp. 21C1]